MKKTIIIISIIIIVILVGFYLRYITTPTKEKTSPSDLSSKDCGSANYVSYCSDDYLCRAKCDRCHCEIITCGIDPSCP